MKQICNGILLRKINYSETSLILHFFTQENGFQAFIFKGGKKKKGNLLQAMSLIEITFYQRRDSDLGKITEISPNFIPQSIPFHPIKSSLVFFMTEILQQTISTTSQDTAMYNFLTEEVRWLDSSDEVTNYPIWFVLQLLKNMGFEIHVPDPTGKILDLQEGTISNRTPKNSSYVEDDTVGLIRELLFLPKIEMLVKSIAKKHRRQILDHLINYLRVHIQGFRPLKSLSVIEEVLSS